MAKLLTYHGPGHKLIVPGYFTLERGGSIEVDDQLARVLVDANPSERFHVLNVSSKTRRSARTKITSADMPGGEPEALEGEGHGNDPHEEEE